VRGFYAGALKRVIVEEGMAKLWMDLSACGVCQAGALKRVTVEEGMAKSGSFKKLWSTEDPSLRSLVT
jgi:hypothetical protein